MAINRSRAYDKIEKIVMEKVIILENENAELKRELTLAQAKLEVYDRLASVSNSERAIGFGRPINSEGR